MSIIRIKYGPLRESLRTGGAGVLDVLHALTHHIESEDADNPAIAYLKHAEVAYKNDRPDMKPETRTVEYYRMWEGNHWDTDFIEIPVDTDEEGIAEAVQWATSAIDWIDGPPVFVGVYNSQDDEE